MTEPLKIGILPERGWVGATRRSNPLGPLVPRRHRFPLRRSSVPGRLSPTFQSWACAYRILVRFDENYFSQKMSSSVWKLTGHRWYYCTIEEPQGQIFSPFLLFIVFGGPVPSAHFLHLWTMICPLYATRPVFTIDSYHCYRLDRLGWHWSNPTHFLIFVRLVVARTEIDWELMSLRKDDLCRRLKPISAKTAKYIFVYFFDLLNLSRKLNFIDSCKNGSMKWQNYSVRQKCWVSKK